MNPSELIQSINKGTFSERDEAINAIIPKKIARHNPFIQYKYRETCVNCIIGIGLRQDKKLSRIKSQILNDYGYKFFGTKYCRHTQVFLNILSIYPINFKMHNLILSIFSLEERLKTRNRACYYSLINVLQKKIEPPKN